MKNVNSPANITMTNPYPIIGRSRLSIFIFVFSHIQEGVTKGQNRSSRYNNCFGVFRPMSDQMTTLRAVLCPVYWLDAYGFRTSAGAGREWSWGSFFLGVVEVVMGLIVMASPGNPSTITFSVISIWALIGGGGLIATAIRLRRRWGAMQAGG
jgi:hypothetical protein